MDPFATKGSNQSQRFSPVPIRDQNAHLIQLGVRRSEFGVRDLKIILSELRTNYSELLHQSVIRQASISLSCQDDMVIDLDSQKSACLHQLFGDPEIIFTRARISARMIVDQDDPGCRLQKRLPKDIPRMNDTRIKGSF